MRQVRKKEGKNAWFLDEKKNVTVKICIYTHWSTTKQRQFIKHYGGAKQKNSGGRGRVSGSVRRFERGEHGDVDRGMPLSLSFLISKSRMCLLWSLFRFFSREKLFIIIIIARTQQWRRAGGANPILTTKTRERERNLLISFFSAKTTRYYERRSALQNWIFENPKSLLSVFLNLAMKPMDALLYFSLSH